MTQTAVPTTLEQRVNDRVQMAVSSLALTEAIELKKPFGENLPAEADRDEEFLKALKKVADTIHILGPKDEAGIEQVAGMNTKMRKISGRLDAWKKEEKAEVVAIGKEMDKRYNKYRKLIDETKEILEEKLKPIREAEKAEADRIQKEQDELYAKRYTGLTETLGMKYDGLKKAFVLGEVTIAEEFVRTASKELLKKFILEQVNPVVERLRVEKNKSDAEILKAAFRAERVRRLEAAGMRMDPAGVNLFDNVGMVSIGSLVLYTDEKFEEFVTEVNFRNNEVAPTPTETLAQRIIDNTTFIAEPKLPNNPNLIDKLEADRSMFVKAHEMLQSILAMKPTSATGREALANCKEKLDYCERYFGATIHRDLSVAPAPE